MDLKKIAAEITDEIAGMDPTTQLFTVAVEHCKMDEITPGSNNNATGQAVIVRDWENRIVGLTGIADDIEKNKGEKILFYAPRRSNLIFRILNKIEEGL